MALVASHLKQRMRSESRIQDNNRNLQRQANNGRIYRYGCVTTSTLINELVTLANIDFQTREEKPSVIGISPYRYLWGLQPNTPVELYVPKNQSVLMVC